MYLTSLTFLFLDCDSIPTGATYDVVYNTDNVIYPDPVPSGKQLPRTTATITCKPDMYFPYSFTNTLTVETTLTFTCSSGTFGATAPVCKKSNLNFCFVSKTAIMVIRASKLKKCLKTIIETFEFLEKIKTF